MDIDSNKKRRRSQNCRSFEHHTIATPPFRRPAFPELERVCHIRIHDPELLLGTSLQKSGRGPFWEGEDALSAFEVREFPAYDVLYSRELHISPHPYPGMKPASYFTRMQIREGSCYLAAAGTPWNIISRFLWQNGEQELYLKAAETHTGEEASPQKT